MARLITSKQTNGSKPEDICLSCGLCCDGVIFVNVRLQPDDNPAPFISVHTCSAKNSVSPSDQTRLIPGIAPRASFAGKQKARLVPQPCIAFDGCRCRIYNQRPRHCRDFTCLLLSAVQTGRTQKPAALQIIRTARTRADKVWRLLRELGDIDEELPLITRFRRTKNRLEQSSLNKKTANLYGELTLAVHALNCLLSSDFYSG